MLPPYFTMAAPPPPHLFSSLCSCSAEIPVFTCLSKFHGSGLPCHLTSLMDLKRVISIHFFSLFPVVRLGVATCKLFICPNGNDSPILYKLILGFNLIPLCSWKNRNIFWPNIVSILVNIPYEFEKNMQDTYF